MAAFCCHGNCDITIHVSIVIMTSQWDANAAAMIVFEMEEKGAEGFQTNLEEISQVFLFKPNNIIFEHQK